MEQFSNNARTVVNRVGGITSTTDSITVLSSVLFPSIPQFRIRIDNEIMLVTSVVGNTFYVQRGSENTNPDFHKNGSIVTHILTAGSINQLMYDIASTPGPQGPPGIQGEQGLQGSDGLKGDPGPQYRFNNTVIAVNTYTASVDERVLFVPFGTQNNTVIYAPPSPSDGDKFSIKNYSVINEPFSINGNGNTIEQPGTGSSSNLIVISNGVQGISIVYEFVSSLNMWISV